MTSLPGTPAGQVCRSRRRYGAMLAFAALVATSSMSAGGPAGSNRALAWLPTLVGVALCHRFLGDSLRSRSERGDVEAFLLCAATVATIAWLLGVLVVVAFLVVAGVL